MKPSTDYTRLHRLITPCLAGRVGSQLSLPKLILINGQTFLASAIRRRFWRQIPVVKHHSREDEYTIWLVCLPMSFCWLRTWKLETYRATVMTQGDHFQTKWWIYSRTSAKPNFLCLGPQSFIVRRENNFLCYFCIFMLSSTMQR